jgi:hypothetical protein
METRESIENRLQELHRQRGRALLHGKSFQNELIVAEHRKLAEIEDMDAARAAQEREESAKASQAQVTAIRTELQDLDVSSLKALAQAETALRSAVAAMRLHHTHEAAKRKAMVG